MYRLIAILFLLSAFCGLQAQERGKIVVHLKDGGQVVYGMADVDFVEVCAEEETAGVKPEVDEIGGTEADAIDMGGSVLWADHNLGATYSFDAGGYFPWNSEAARLWSEGWRLPTEKEWQELYDHCQWRWEIRCGTGGRLVTSPEGQSIFIPATGLKSGESTLVDGSIGIYWTADACEPEPATPLKATGVYFDSANIYRIEYPTDNLFTVRLVKEK